MCGWVKEPATRLFEVPSSLMLARFSAPQWIARIMITWGFLAAGMMFVHTPLQFYVMRFLLGVAEAGFFPSVIYYFAGWFPMACRGRAVSRIYVASSLASVVMGAMPVRHSLVAAFANPRVLLLGSVGLLGNGAGNGLLLSAPAVLIAGPDSIRCRSPLWSA
jgi:MFS family permease